MKKAIKVLVGDIWQYQNDDDKKILFLVVEIVKSDIPYSVIQLNTNQRTFLSFQRDPFRYNLIARARENNAV